MHLDYVSDNNYEFIKFKVNYDSLTSNYNAGDFTVKPRVTENPNLKMKQCRVTPVCAKFYATGQKTLAPTWTQNLRVK